MSGVNTPASAASSAAITAGASNPIVQISTFLTRLPAEVRVKIYQELFRNRHIFWAQDIPYFFPGRPSIRTLYHCKPLIDHGWPRNSTAILCSCKQIRSEAHPIFFDTITHHIDISNIVKFPDSPGLFSYDTIVNLELEMYCFLRITPGFIRRIFPRAANIILNFTEDRGIFYRRPDDPPLIFEILRADPAARNRVFSDARRLVYRLGLLEVRWKQIMESLQVKMDDWIPGQGQTTYQPIVSSILNKTSRSKRAPTNTEPGSLDQFSVGYDRLRGWRLVVQRRSEPCDRARDLSD